MLPDVSAVVSAIKDKNTAFSVSEHFTLGEMIYSDTARALNIDNWPGDGKQPNSVVDVAGNFLLLCFNVLEPVRAWYNKPMAPDAGFNSIFRCSTLNSNKAIGGAKDSQHLTGQAVDLKLPGVSTVDLANWVRDNLPSGYDQIILEYYTRGVPTSGWVHVSWRKESNRKQLLTIGPGYTLNGFHP